MNQNLKTTYERFATTLTFNKQYGVWVGRAHGGGKESGACGGGGGDKSGQKLETMLLTVHGREKKWHRGYTLNYKPAKRATRY